MHFRILVWGGQYILFPIPSETAVAYETIHLLQANNDIRTIQTLLGHADVRTIMIYNRCVPSRTVKEAKSPLDF
jgi:integrase